MTPYKANRKSMAIPPRMTLNLITDTFQVMLENMGMTEACIVQYMTSLKGFKATQIGQLRQALKLAVDMGLVTFRDERFMFTIENLEHLIAHKNQRKKRGESGPSADRRSVVSDYLMSARAAKRRISVCRTSKSKRSRHDADVPPTRACRSHFKPYRTKPLSPPCARSVSLDSLRSSASSGGDTHRGIKNPRPRPMRRKRRRLLKKKSTRTPYVRVSQRKAVTPLVSLDEAGPSVPVDKRNVRGLKRITRGKTSYNNDERDLLFVPKKRRRKSTASVTSKHSVESVSTTKTGSSVKTVSSSTHSKKSKAPSKTSRKSDEEVEVYRKVVPRERRLETASMLNEYLTTTSFTKSRRGGGRVRGSGASSVAGSKAGSNLSKTSSATSVITNGTDDNKKADGDKKPTSVVAPLRKSFATTLVPTLSGSSFESGGTKASSNTDVATASEGGGVGEHRLALRSKRQEEGSAKDSNTSSMTSVNTDETAESARDAREGKRVTSTASKSSNASKGSSQSSWKTTESTVSTKKQEANLKDQKSGVKTRNSDSSLESKGSNVSKTTSRTSVNTNDTAESARSTRTKKPEGNSPTPRKPSEIKQGKSENRKSATTAKCTSSKALRKSDKTTEKLVGKCKPQESSSTAASTSTSFTRSVVLRKPSRASERSIAASKSTASAGRAKRRVGKEAGGTIADTRRRRSSTRFVGNNNNNNNNNADDDDEEPDTRALHDFYT